MIRDKRKFERFKILLNLEIKPTKVATEYLFGIIRNFSQEGFSFVSEKFELEPGENMELRLKHPLRNNFIFAFGEIIWKREVNNRCVAGLKLRAMDKDAKDEILKYAYDKQIKSKGNF